MLDSGQPPPSSPEIKNDNFHKGACMELRTTANRTEVKRHVQHAWWSLPFCQLGISQQGSAMGICLCPWPESHIPFFNISLLVQGDGRSTRQAVQEVFILLERKSPCQRSMARLARMTVIPNLQFLFSKQFLAGRSRLCALWILSELRYEGRGARKEGGRRGKVLMVIAVT